MYDRIVDVSISCVLSIFFHLDKISIMIINSMFYALSIFFIFFLICRHQIQGSESDIRAKFYSIAFQIMYNEDEGIAEWKIVDYQFAGETPYY